MVNLKFNVGFFTFLNTKQAKFLLSLVFSLKYVVYAYNNSIAFRNPASPLSLITLLPEE